MKSKHSFILFFFLSLVVACSTEEEEPLPEEIPTLPLLTDFKVAQSKWVPEKMTIGYDTIDNRIAVIAKNREASWYMILENNSKTIDFSKPFNIEYDSLEYPDSFEATYRKLSSESPSPYWVANHLNQLIRFEISEIYQDETYTYCDGRIDIYASGDQLPKTLRIAGDFKNVPYGRGVIR